MSIKYSSESLLVVTAAGNDKKDVLIRLRCPFTVAVISDIPNLELNQAYQVQSVQSDKNGVLVYFVLGKAYYYYNFSILL